MKFKVILNNLYDYLSAENTLQKIRQQIYTLEYINILQLATVRYCQFHRK